MRVTIKGQETIPQHIREKFGITPGTEVDFLEENGRVYLAKRTGINTGTNKLRHFRDVATVKMSTEEIMSLTRGDE
ncbi:hypothetical protein ES703_50178 [subsurface metagenome]